MNMYLKNIIFYTIQPLDRPIVELIFVDGKENLRKRVYSHYTIYTLVDENNIWVHIEKSKSIIRFIKSVWTTCFNALGLIMLFLIRCYKIPKRVAQNMIQGLQKFFLKIIILI